MGRSAALSAVDPIIEGERVRHLPDDMPTPGIHALALEYEEAIRRFLRQTITLRIPEIGPAHLDRAVSFFMGEEAPHAWPIQRVEVQAMGTPGEAGERRLGGAGRCVPTEVVVTMRAREDKDAAIVDAEIVVDRRPEEPAKVILDVEIVASDPLRARPRGLLEGRAEGRGDQRRPLARARGPADAARLRPSSAGSPGLALGYWFGQREGRG